MKLLLAELQLTFKRATSTIPLADVSYFFGQMGAGKTSIAKLIDYCLGNDLDLSPALQSEFVSATLKLELRNSPLSLERPRESNQVIATWASGDEIVRAVVPADSPAGIVVPDTPVETVSDLIFWLSGMSPVRVRRSKVNEDSELSRLSLRDLMWYCYLDQESMDSSFFHLEEGGHPFKRLKSRDVLRFVVGFHADRVVELESLLDASRLRRQELLGTIAGLKRALSEVGIESAEMLLAEIARLEGQVADLSGKLQETRNKGRNHVVHAVDSLRIEARDLGKELAQLEEAIVDSRDSLRNERAHLHEVETLAVKFRRSAAARTVLSGVSFTHCPRCAQDLPSRPALECPVCGQSDVDVDPSEHDLQTIDNDVRNRMTELRDVIERRELAIKTLRNKHDLIQASKLRVERERNTALERYDSAYLSTVVKLEREQSALLQAIDNLKSLSKFPQLVEILSRELDKLQSDESKLRTQLSEARAAAERDSSTLEDLKALFLDCLLRSHVPGIRQDDLVLLDTRTFLPEIVSTSGGERTMTSFSNMSSGGKKSLFKACFAIAVHRLSHKVGAILPQLLIIDSPMKNISERENRVQFESFHAMLYELKSDELLDTQLIVIDKEFCPPKVTLEGLRFEVRHMRPDDQESPPLIPYYRGL